MDWVSKPPIGTPLRDDDPLNIGLTGFWPLWEGSGRGCYDISGNGWHGTEAEAAADQRILWTGGRAGGHARLFDGSNDRIEIAGLFFPAAATDPYTVSFWFRTSTTGDRAIVGMYNGVTAQRALVRIQSTDKLALWHAGTSIATTVGVCDGRWHHGVVCKRGSGTNETEVWLDGALNVRGTNNNYYDQAAPLRIGGNVASAGYFSGALEDVRLWKGRALSREDIQRLYASPWSVFEPDPIWQFVSAGGGGIEATGSITEAADTASSTGTVDVQAAGSITEAADTVSSAGTVDVQGAGSITEAADTVSSEAVVGSVPVEATGSITEAADTVSSAGTVDVQAVGSITEAADTVSSAGTVDVQAAGSITEAADTVSSDGVVGSAPIEATGSITEATDTVSGAGEVTTPAAISASGAIAEAADTLVSAATTREFVAGNTNVFYLKPRPTRFAVSPRPTRWELRRAA